MLNVTIFLGWLFVHNCFLFPLLMGSFSFLPMCILHLFFYESLWVVNLFVFLASEKLFTFAFIPTVNEGLTVGETLAVVSDKADVYQIVISCGPFLSGSIQGLEKRFLLYPCYFIFSHKHYICLYKSFLITIISFVKFFSN